MQALVRLLSLMIVLSLISCEMIDRTERMEDTSNQIRNIARGSSDNITRSIAMGRAAGSRASRVSAIEDLEESKTFHKKLSSGFVYFNAMEFQNWVNNGFDTHAYRVELFGSAMSEFFKAIGDYVEKVGDLSKVSPTSKSDAAQNLFALSVTMHAIHKVQHQITDLYDLPKVSVKSLITDTLAKYSGENAYDDDAPEFEKEIMENKEVAQFMINLRMNMLPAMALAKISDIQKKYPVWHIGISKLLKKIRMFLFKWDSKFAKLNHFQQKKVIKFVDEAVKMKHYLESIGETPVLNSKIAKIFKKMRRKLTGKDGCQTQRCQDNLDEFLSKIDALYGTE